MIKRSRGGAMTLRETFKKQGGINLLKQYWRSGSFFTAVAEFVLLGKSRTALEILRLSAGLKTKQRFEKKYKKALIAFDKNWKAKDYDNVLNHKSSKMIWICWFQGMENAPEVVQKCYQSVRENIPDREIILITMENMKEYVTFPDYILEKWKSGQITNTHMTDLLRLELLIQYGGMWLDATVFCSGGDIPEYFFDSDLFFFQCLKPGRDGHSGYISSWLISAKTNNKLLMATRNLCYEYWKQNKEMADYFLLHDFMSIVLDFYPKNWKEVVPRDNAAPHILQFQLFDQYDESMWQAIKAQTPFHKLTYKFKESQTKLHSTYYEKLLK
jgi:hypothetical protein